MKRYIVFTGATADHKRAIRALLKKLDITSDTCEFKDLDGFFWIRMLDSDSRMGAFTAALDKMESDVTYSLRQEVKYTKREVLASPFCKLRITRKESVDFGLDLDTDYDFAAACRSCGTGAVQTSPMRVLRSELPKSGQVTQSLDQQPLVADDVASLLMKSPGMKACLRQVEQRKTHAPLPWWQILPTRSLPRMHAKSSGVLWAECCAVCKRDGFGQDLSLPIELAYESGIVDACMGAGALATWEHFGSSERLINDPSIRSLALPLVILDAPAVRILVESKVRGVEFTPLILV